MKAKMNKKVIVSILVVILIGVISGGVYGYQSKSEYDKQVKLERDKNYHKLATSADEVVELAYNSRKDIDIENADSSKIEADLLNAQKAIDNLKDKYQEKDKVTFQEKLNDIKKAIADEKARAKAEQEAKAKTEQERKALEQASVLSQNNVFDYINKFLVMRGYNPIGNEPQASTETPASNTTSSFDVKYQEKDGTGTGMFRVTKTLDGQVQVVKYVGSSFNTDGMEYVSLP